MKNTERKAVWRFEQTYYLNHEFKKGQISHVSTYRKNVKNLCGILAKRLNDERWLGLTQIAVDLYGSRRDRSGHWVCLWTKKKKETFKIMCMAFDTIFDEYSIWWGARGRRGIANDMGKGDHQVHLIIPCKRPHCFALVTCGDWSCQPWRSSKESRSGSFRWGARRCESFPSCKSCPDCTGRKGHTASPCPHGDPESMFSLA